MKEAIKFLKEGRDKFKKDYEHEKSVINDWNKWLYEKNLIRLKKDIAEFESAIRILRKVKK